jgi:uncharacterized hydrophobic protein (TIGR00271 family)
MMTVSAFIASFGLSANNTAVIIGAMLVAPLMIPIFGISLGMLMGNAVLLARAFRSVLIGIIMAVVIAVVYGLLPIGLEVTSEMLARTRPNLLDLLVAVLAGFAGSYATVDERLSPGLPGVAIAVSLVPPLANTGLCLAAGAYSGASGSFLLFLANLFSIILVSSVIFFLAGLSRKSLHDQARKVVGGFTVTIIGFVIVAVFLTNSLVRIVKERQLHRAIEESLTEHISRLSSASLDDMIYDLEEGKLYIHATTRASTVFAPDEVSTIQQAVSRDVRRPVVLIIRTVPFKDMSATGSIGQVIEQNLDGFFLDKTMTPKEVITRKAEQVLWEELSVRPGFEVMDVEFGQRLAGNSIIATVKSYRQLRDDEVREIEEVLQERLKDSSIRLIVSTLSPTIVTSKGQLMYEWVNLKRLTLDKEKKMGEVNAVIDRVFNEYHDLFPVNFNYVLKEDAWKILIEVVGARVMTPQEVAEINRKVSEEVSQPLKIYIWSRIDSVVTEEGYNSFEDFTGKNIREFEEELEKIYQR